MKTELVNKISEYLQNLSPEDSDLMVLAEKHLSDEYLESFAESLQEIVTKFRELKDFVQFTAEDLTDSDIDELGDLANALDASGDPDMQKKASVLDEILMTIGADPKALQAFKKAEFDEINRLREKYRKERREEIYSTSDSSFDKAKKEQYTKAVEDKVKVYRPLEASLSSRYSPDMPGVSLIRISDNVFQCPVTKKIYDYSKGFTTAKGNKVPGTGVSGQTDLNKQVDTEHMQFGSRESILSGS